MNDPRPNNPFGKLYSVEYLGNMVGGSSTRYNNQPVDLLKKAAAASIKDGEVWHGSEHFSEYPNIYYNLAYKIGNRKTQYV